MEEFLYQTMYLFGSIVFLALAWAAIVLALFFPSFRLRKLNKLIAEDKREFHELEVETKNMTAAKEAEKKSFEEHVINKQNIIIETKKVEADLKRKQDLLSKYSDDMKAYQAWLETPAGKLHLESKTKPKGD